MHEVKVGDRTFTVRNFLSDGTEIDDLSTHTLPIDNPAYQFIADLFKKQDAQGNAIIARNEKP